jgi:hypothetical protein
MDTTETVYENNLFGLNDFEKKPLAAHPHMNTYYSLSLRRAARGSKRMRLEFIHGLFIT